MSIALVAIQKKNDDAWIRNSFGTMTNAAAALQRVFTVAQKMGFYLTLLIGKLAAVESEYQSKIL